MIKFIFLKFLKTLMMTTPFLSMILMLSALWGVFGKTTYADINPTGQQNEMAAVHAKNYLVNETKSNLCTTELKTPETGADENKSNLEENQPLPQNIDLEHVI